MKAVAVTRYLPPEQPEALLDVELPDPIPGPRDLIVRIEAVALNQLDLRVLRPKDRIEPSPRVLGWDAAGVVVAVGREVTLFKTGDRVCYAGDINRPGTYSELHAVDERLAGRLPEKLGFAHGAALPLAGITAWEALFDRMRIPQDPQANRGKRIVIIGGGGGVASMAIQLAAQVAGLTVVATASRPESAEWVRSLGAADVIDHRGDLPAQAAALGHREADYVLIAGDFDRHYVASTRLVAPQGAIGTVVEATQPIDFGLLWDKSVSLSWEMVFTRTDFRTADMAQHGRILTRLGELAAAGVIRSPLTRDLGPIRSDSLRTGLQQLQTGRTLGKLVMRGF